MPEIEEKTENVPTVKAYKNPDFLASHHARHVRVMCELQEPAQRLQKNGIDNYFFFVGSHSVMHPDERQAQIAEFNKTLQKGGPRDEMEALASKIRFAKQMQSMDRYYVVAMELAGKLARWNKERQAQGLPSYNVCSGGGPGVMEAANRGAADAGATTLGLGSTRPEWGQMNKYVSQGSAFEFHYFFMRKFWCMYKCMGLIAFPGGYGSLDELFEALTLVNSHRIEHRMPIILLGRDYWKKAINWEYLVECSMLSQQNLDLITFLDTADEAFEFLKDQVRQADESGENNLLQEKKRRRLTKYKVDNSNANI
jgi:hypothetical protein